MGGLFENKVSSKSGKYASELHFRSLLGVILEPRGTHKLKQTCFFDVCFSLFFIDFRVARGAPKQSVGVRGAGLLEEIYQAHP